MHHPSPRVSLPPLRSASPLLRSASPLLCSALLCLGVLVGCSSGGVEGGGAAGADAGAGADAALEADGVSGDVTAADVTAADASGADVEAGEDGAASGAFVPQTVCHEATGWDGTTPLFVEITEEAGLVGAGVQVLGGRLGAADIDGDGFPELMARRHRVFEREDFGPEGKRSTHLMRNDTAQPGGAIQMTDITEASGLLQTRDGAAGVGRTAHVVVFGDADNDGDVDAFAGVFVDVPSGDKVDPGDSSELMLNDGAGAFSLTPAPLFEGPGLRSALSSATWTDYDRDGALDLFLGFTTYDGAPAMDRLLRGDGAGGLADVTAAEGMQTLPFSQLGPIAAGTSHKNTWGTGSCDFNNDGHPDLYTTSYGRYYNGLWLGGGVAVEPTGARFHDVQLDTGFGRDDNDDWTTNINAQCYCSENPSADACDQAPPPQVNCAALKQAFGGTYRWNHQYDRQPWRLGGTTGTGICADLNRDGAMDFVQFDIVHGDVGPSSDPSHVMLGDGAAVPTFSHVPNTTSGLAREHADPFGYNEGDITGAVADFDGDGRLDILIGATDYPDNKALLYLQQPDGTWALAPSSLTFEHNRANGVAVADFDRDGDLDVAIGHSRARCGGSLGADCPPDEQVRLYRNEMIGPTSARMNWLQLRLVGTGGSNRAAIGARVTVEAGGATQTLRVDGGHGHFGQQHDLVLHAGLGAACTIDKVTVRWPDISGTTEVFEGVAANHLVELVQGDPTPRYPLDDPDYTPPAVP